MTENEAAGINADFSLDDEYKEDPLCPKGPYFGNVTGVSINAESQAIVWQVVLEGNDGLMSDGVTPIDGSQHFYRNWLPKPGDEDLQTKSGRGNKRQAKINMMKKFADGMEIDMDTPAKIMESIEIGDWVGIPVIVSIDVDEYEGVVRNQINKMSLNKEA